MDRCTPYDLGVEEIRIGGSARDRRIGLIALALGLVVVVAFGVWVYFTGDPVTAKDARPLVVIATGTILLGAFYVSYIAFGHTTLSALHLRTWSPLRHRTVPWPEIAAVELHSRTSRGGTVWMVRVRLAAGGSFIVPGTQTGSDHAAALAKLKTINEYWASEG